MGSGTNYYSDVSTARAAIGQQRQTTDSTFAHSRNAEARKVAALHPDLDVRGPNGTRIRECLDMPSHPTTTPIGIIFDVTGSNQRNVPQFWEHAPSLMGILQGFPIVPDPSVLWAAVGDAQYHHGAPIQIAQFENGAVLDEQLRKLFLRENGGGNDGESYEIMAYYFSKFVRLDSVIRRKTPGHLAFFADEKPFPMLRAAQVREHLGDSLREDIPTTQVFAELRKNFTPWAILMGGASDRSSYEYQAWLQYFPESHLLVMRDPAASIHTFVSALAIDTGSMTVDEVRQHLLHDWKASRSIANEVMYSLEPLIAARASKIDESIFA